MSRTLGFSDRRSGRCRPRVERLESRLALSLSPVPEPVVMSLTVGSVSAFDLTDPGTLGPDLNVVATDPAPGSTWTESPATITVTFDRPVDPFSLGFGDVLIQRLQPDGSWALAHDDLSYPGEALDESGTQLLLTPVWPLEAGTYRLVLPETTFVTGADGSFVAPVGDQVLSEFLVSQPGVTLADAVDLGTLGDTPLVVGGSLDLDANPSAVELFRFEVPAGHHWLFGGELAAGRDGSPLLARLALFDAEGRLLRGSTKGRRDAPTDPYLFAGLEPGTYYLGVSGAGNVPGLGGYDPATGERGTIVFGQASGSFNLSLVADPADSPSEVQLFALQWGDPLFGSPTGFTLAFSSLLDNATIHGDPSPGFRVVASNGAEVPFTAVGYDEQHALYDFLFDQPLEPGSYRVEFPASGGATDLAGWRPVAPGQPAGVLASFVVAPPRGARSPNDLGPLFRDVQDGLAFRVEIQPGTAVTHRFVVTAEGLYQFGTSATEAVAPGGLTMRLIGSHGLTSEDATPPGSLQRYLEPGVYYVQFVNHGDQSLSLRWTLVQKTPRDSLLDNGVGQGPALNLRLVNPSSAPGMTASSPSGLGPQSPPPPLTGAYGPASPYYPNVEGPTSPTGTSNATSSGALAPGGLYLTVGNTVVGRPSAEAEHVAVAGTAGASGTTALAYAADGLPQGIGDSLRLNGRLVGPGTTVAPDVEGSVVVAEPTVLADGSLPEAPMAPEKQADQAVIAASDWLSQLAAAAARLASGFTGGSVEVDLEANSAVAVAEADRAGDPPLGEGRVEEAHIETPLVIGAASVLAMRYHEPFRRWVERLHRKSSAQRGARSMGRFRGPHRRI